VRELGLTYAHLWSFLRQPRVLGGVIVGFTMFFGFVSIFTYLPYRMQAPLFSLSQSQISLLYLVYLVGFLATPWTGRLSDRFGRRFVIGASLVLMISGSIFTSLDAPIGPALSAPAIGLAISPALNGTLVGLILLNIGLLAAHAAASAFVNEKAKEGSQNRSRSRSPGGWLVGASDTRRATGLVWGAL
jgi:YNFM family putative membrane transporter